VIEVTRAILVEDDTEFRQCVKKILSSRYPSIQLIEARDGKEAMSKVDLLPPDIIFMDIQLPDKNGLELTRMIKASHPDAIIVILSSYDLTEYREAAYRNGANYYISKDSPMGDLFSLIERIMENQVTRRDCEGKRLQNI
jgi:DNA-binding NarL/FixJ family response regulator